MIPTQKSKLNLLHFNTAYSKFNSKENVYIQFHTERENNKKILNSNFTTQYI